MQRGKSTYLIFALFLLVALTGTAAAQGNFFNSSPGPLATSHAAWDDPAKCNDCHVNDTREVSNAKCLGCHDHKDLAARINAGKGYHASAGVKGKACATCHSDHQGRPFDLMGWKAVPGGEKKFNHTLAGWDLNGKHATTDCFECHKARNKQGLRVYMNTDRLCGSSGCHATDQPHKFVRKDMLACERCHGENVWKPPKDNKRFNHSDRKDAGMDILGAHRDVACSKCHPKAVFNLPADKPANCGNAGCHEKENPHKGHIYGERPCDWCHSPTFKTLKQVQIFDHSGNTRFDLGPAHNRIKCYDCHTKALGVNKPTGNCSAQGCHAKDNKHGERFEAYGKPMPRCQTCHPSGGPKWTPSAFNHASTGFKLEFEHGKQKCRSCHLGNGPSDFLRFNIDPKKNCMGCHAHKKVHSDDQNPNGKYKNTECLKCHLNPGNPQIRQGKSNEMVDLIHGVRGQFPLVKEHKPVPCADCHTGRDKKGKTSFSGLKPNCNAQNATGQPCHEDSLHKGTLGAKCITCHTSGTWPALIFNHDKPFPPDAKGNLKEYPLKGAHKTNKCEACHTEERKFAGTPSKCSDEACHAEDDAHKGRLGKDCENCHVETGDNLFNHNTMSVFHLDGKHLEVTCADCHPSVTFKPRPSNCFGCHPEPAVHKGQYGTGCEQCHTTRTWEDIKPLHDVGDFSLRGAHNNLACERCHRDNRPLAGSGNLCINCHRQDDIHNNGLSPRCGECHSQWSFTPARFDHGRVGCNLTGLHRTIACFDCHKNGNFSGLSPICAGCHRDDDLRASVRLIVPAHGAQTACATCHNPNTWLPAMQPGTAIGRESVCR